jgi:hypothetical protein
MSTTRTQDPKENLQGTEVASKSASKAKNGAAGPRRESPRVYP